MIQDKIKEHNRDLTELRNDRLQTRAKISLSIKSTEEVISSFNSDYGSSLVSFTELYALEKEEVYHINENIYFILVYKDENKIVLDTYMSEGGTFGLQEHDCFEICEIIKGILIEKERGYKAYGKGEIVTYSPFEKHKPYSSQDSVYKVTFLKKI